jgi:hypothetical protein
MKKPIKVIVAGGLLALLPFDVLVSPVEATGDQYGFEAAKEAVIYDESVVQKAVEDIGKMQEAELRSFMHYLAECSDEPIAEPSLHFCNSATEYYQIEFYNNRAVDMWIINRSGLMNLPLKFKGHEGETVQEGAEWNAKYGKIVAAIEQAVRDRLHTLKSTKSKEK